MNRAGASISEPLAERLAASPDPIVAFHAQTLLCGERMDTPEIDRLRSRIADSSAARALLDHRDQAVALNPYAKWQGAHWTLTSFALIGYPPGDARLRPLFDRVNEWLLSRKHSKPPSTTVYPGQEDRVRRCVSQEGNAVWYAVRLGHLSDDAREIVDRIVAWQWPDGGWNCDKRPDARSSSFQETTIPLRGLFAYWAATGYEPAKRAADRAAELLLSRRLLWRLHDGALIRPDWGGAVDRIHYPIQFHDLLFAAQVMLECGLIADPRCADATDLLASRRLPDGGFPIDDRNARRSGEIASRTSWCDWGPGGPKTASPVVTAIALAVLAARGRFGVVRLG